MSTRVLALLSSRRRWVFALCSVGLLTVAGCGGTGVPVYGEVALDGKPLQSGVIKFVPHAGVPGPTASTTIEDGEYAFGRSNGPVAGNYSVEIYQDQPPPEGLDDPQEFVRANGALAPPQNGVAPRFNKQTTLKAVVDPDGELELNFTVASGLLQ